MIQRRSSDPGLFIIFHIPSVRWPWRLQQGSAAVFMCVCMRSEEPTLPSVVPAQQVHIRGNLFHNIATSCFSPTLEACTEGGGRDLGDGQTLCTRHSFLAVRRGQNPRWSFLRPCRLPACQNKCWIVENKLISFAWQHVPSGYDTTPVLENQAGSIAHFQRREDVYH